MVMAGMLVAVGTVHATAATTTTTGPAAPAAEPAAAPVTSGPATATLVDSYFSTAAQQLVLVIEVSTTEKISIDARSAVYVGPDGQQVEASDGIAPDDLFPGATGIIVMVFPAAQPGGTVNWQVYNAEYTNFDFSMQVPAS